MTVEKIEKIRELAGLFFTYEEIAILIEANPDEFIAEVKNNNTDIYKAYISGKMEGEYKIRKKTYERAIKGSPAAEEILLKHIQTQKIREAK